MANSFSRVYASPPSFSPTLDFPSLDAPYKPALTAEQLTAHPTVGAAINRIVAAAGQMAATVQVPFLTLCDAGMGYHLPGCLRILEAAHVVEVLRDGPVHVCEIAARTAHILRLLATHHILREAAPDVFAAGRISSLIDSGELVANPETKYTSVGDAVAVFVGLCTDELFKSSAYLTEVVFPGNARLYPASSASSSPSLSSSSLLPSPSPSSPPSSSSSSYSPTALDISSSANESTSISMTSSNPSTAPSATATATGSDPTSAPFNYAFGRGGVGYFAWLEGEGWSAAPGEVGFDWASLPRGSVVVDVGGGIGSPSMLLASAYAEVDTDGSGGLRFVIQDRPVIVEMGEKAWRAKCRELLDSGAVRFLHPAAGHRRCGLPPPFLLRLREAAAPHTKLVLANSVLPLACVDDLGVWEGGMDVQVEGAEKMVMPAPLLANLGKRARTLKEDAHCVGEQMQKVVRVTKAPGSLFGHIVVVPVAVPVSPQRARTPGAAPRSSMCHARAGRRNWKPEAGEMEMVERASSCGTPMFGSRINLTSEARAVWRGRCRRTTTFWRFACSHAASAFETGCSADGSSGAEEDAVPAVRCLSALVPFPNLPSYRPGHVPAPSVQQQQQHASSITRRIPQAPLRTQSQQLHPPAPSPVPWQPPPPSPTSPRLSLRRRSSADADAAAQHAAPRPEAARAGSVAGIRMSTDWEAFFCMGVRGHGDSEGGDFNDELLSRRVSPVLLPARSVLAVAARIERGISRAPSPDL
ncbi:hypothetical protein DFH08DRAFT_960419 [Mycena albidolilacea]|uniref:O-methyltransferase domain-containing protein n=1 Tax=Mycena albidolilacea TaxID=1033008 RepID=A0AAD7ETE4_9AGAR|nr:hypothetical protein DFH08DRAFT_960419 [Mycena albidolilacea]